MLPPLGDWMVDFRRMSGNYEDHGGASDRDGLARAHEQARSDCSTNGDELDVTVGKSALEVRFAGGFAVGHRVVTRLSFVY